MIFDVRKTGLLHVADAVRDVAGEAGKAHVYVESWIVTVLHDWRPVGSYIGSYDGRATHDHIMSDVAAEVGSTVRRRK